MSMSENGRSGKRTLVEFYDAQYLENIVSLLYSDYADVVYVYFSRANEPTEQDRRVLSEYIRNNFCFAPKFLEVGENTIESALAAFRKLTNHGGVYDFDITGGSSVFIAAAGALAVVDGGKRIFLHECDPLSGKRMFSYPEHDAAVRRDRAVSLTVDHVLALRGIEIRYPEKPVRYRLDKDDLRGETIRLWDVIRGELKAWNTFSSLPSHTRMGRGCCFVTKQMTDRKKSACSGLLKKLGESGIISELKESRDGGNIEISYRLNVPESALVLYDKGGNILELLTYVAAVDSGCFADCCTGISLDWDAESRHASADPYNEIDTVLTRGHIPYFISCKNTDVQNDYLYEIMVMARHYGGKYAVPGLICTTRCNVHLHGRAKEMGLILIDDIAALSTHQFKEKLISKLSGK